MKRSFFIALALYLLLLGALWKLYEPLPVPKKKTIHIADIKILKPKACECGCKMQKIPKKETKSMPKKEPQPPSRPKPKLERKPKPKPKIEPKPKPKVEPKPKPKVKPKRQEKRKVARKQKIKKSTDKNFKPKKAVSTAPILQPSKPTPSPPPQPVPKSSSLASQEPKESYQHFYVQSFLDQIEEAIRRHTHYPRIARRTRKEGVVELCFTLRPSGEVVHLHIMKSSGHKILDRAAKKTIVKAAKEFPHPKKEVELQVPIEYRLR